MGNKFITKTGKKTLKTIKYTPKTVCGCANKCGFSCSDPDRFIPKGKSWNKIKGNREKFKFYYKEF